jgi:hypothetical protein
LEEAAVKNLITACNVADPAEFHSFAKILVRRMSKWAMNDASAAVSVAVELAKAQARVRPEKLQTLVRDLVRALRPAVSFKGYLKFVARWLTGGAIFAGPPTGLVYGILHSAGIHFWPLAGAIGGGLILLLITGAIAGSIVKRANRHLERGRYGRDAIGLNDSTETKRLFKELVDLLKAPGLAPGSVAAMRTNLFEAGVGNKQLSESVRSDILKMLES